MKPQGTLFHRPCSRASSGRAGQHRFHAACLLRSRRAYSVTTFASIALVYTIGRRARRDRTRVSTSSDWAFGVLSAMFKAMRLPVVLRDGEDGWITAECLAIPGCATQGRTRAAAISNIIEAIQLCLETREAEGWSVSTPEILEVEVPAPAD